MAINRLAIPGPLEDGRHPRRDFRCQSPGAAAASSRRPTRRYKKSGTIYAGLIASTDACALEAAVDAVIGAGADYDDDLLIAARTRVDFLVKTDDARAELEKALAACSDDASALMGTRGARGRRRLDPEGRSWRRAGGGSRAAAGARRRPAAAAAVAPKTTIIS